MSKEIDRVKRKFAERIAEAGANSSYGTVVGVDEQNRTCDVQVGGIVREGVLLYALEAADKKGWFLVPAVGSIVLVSRIGTGTRLRVSMFSEIDKVVCTIGNTDFSITEKGYKLNRDKSGLLKTLTDLCTAIEKMTVSTAMGPSSIPINVAAFTKIKEDLKGYLEG